MTVPFPTPQWPSGLLEAGPEQDPTILLRSTAEIGGAAYVVTAIRIDPISMTADLRNNVPARAYRDHRLTEILEELSNWTDITDRSLVRLETGNYVMLMIPAETN